MWVSTQKNTFNYLGSKYSILQWLYQYLPETQSWIDLFGGSGVVTMNRRPSPIETYNDKNEQVVNFFRQLRSDPAKLIHLLELTPHSRLEYNDAWDSEEDDGMEKARKFFIRVRQSFFATGCQQQKKGWLFSNKDSRNGVSQSTNKYLRSVEGLDKVYERFKRVQLECKDFEYIIKFYDTPDALIYGDAPYDDEKTSGTNQYKDAFGFEDHVRLRDAAEKVQGKIAISGYDTDFMKSLYKHFYFVPGPAPKNAKRKTAARECLWTNYDPNKITNTLFN